MIEPMKAAVRPRVYAGNSGAAVLLEDLVSEAAASGFVNEIKLRAGAGFGMTTALRHIAAVMGAESGLEIHDAQPLSSYLRSDAPGVIVFPKAPSRRQPIVWECELTRWGRDEWIEYLLATHKDQCASVMTRALNDHELLSLEGNPGILSMVLDELAADDQLPDVKSALKQIIDRSFSGESLQADVNRVVRKTLSASHAGNVFDLRKIAVDEFSMVNRRLTAEQLQLFGIGEVRFYFESQVAWSDLIAQTPTDLFRRCWPRRLISIVAGWLVESPAVQDALRVWIASDHELQSTSISLLHAAGAEWSLPPVNQLLESKPRNNLDKVILDGADCTAKTLAGCSMLDASFQKANLSYMNLKRANARYANFNQANLSGADLSQLTGASARFNGANLSCARGEYTQFVDSDLSQADLSDAQFEFCDFSGAKLHKTSFRRARLTECDFRNADLSETDFFHCDLFAANLNNLDLTTSNCFKANFRRALMKRCNLEGMELPDADFNGASLKHAVFTGSVMPRASFYAADLRFAKLSEVDWEFANLRDADLTGATFHMGSSRSGLLKSFNPMEGSKTGFYTDELNEQDFKAPEEIRKANLRYADLRGARIDGVDFYLVDLRDALYDSMQVDQLRSTGAILESREC